MVAGLLSPNRCELHCVACNVSEATLWVHQKEREREGGSRAEGLYKSIFPVYKEGCAMNIWFVVKPESPVWGCSNYF